MNTPICEISPEGLAALNAAVESLRANLLDHAERNAMMRWPQLSRGLVVVEPKDVRTAMAMLADGLLPKETKQ